MTRISNLIVGVLVVCVALSGDVAAQSSPGSMVSFPSWLTDLNGSGTNVAVSVAASSDGPMTLGRTSPVHTALGDTVISDASSGVLGVHGTNGMYGLVTRFAAIYHVSLCDLSTLNPLFGDESILVSGVLPNGASGVSVIVRNAHDALSSAAHYDLPLTSFSGEVFLRVGIVSGVLLVFETQGMAVIPFDDSNADGVPDRRLPAIFGAGPNKVESFDGFFAPDPAVTYTPQAVALLEDPTFVNGAEAKALYIDTGTFYMGRVLTGVAPPIIPTWDFPMPLRPGLRRVQILAAPEETYSIEILRAQNPGAGFVTWTAATLSSEDGGLEVSLATAGSPLETGDKLRIVVGGSTEAESYVGDRGVIVAWDWGIEADILGANAFAIDGENLSEVATVSLVWVQTDVAPSVETTHSLSFSLAGNGLSLLVQAPPALAGASGFARLRLEGATDPLTGLQAVGAVSSHAMWR